MITRTIGCRRALLGMLAALLLLSPAPVRGQGATSLSGTVVDGSGAVVPGADVTVVAAATGTTFSAVTDARGSFTMPAMPAATYAVTVKLSGFKTAVLQNVKLEVGVAATVKAVLEVGGMEEQVTVTGGADVLQAQSATVSTTMSVKQITQLPLVSRNAMDFVAFMPGAMSTGVNRDMTFNGLPQSTLNITLDGINIQDNGAKTGDGFQVAVKPLQDQIEEVTVSTAANDAASAGGGAVQVRYVTRSGTNEFKGSLYHYMRNPALNANYWFNNRDLPPDPRTGKAPKDIVNLNQYGGRIGGPILLPGFDGHNKAFFFFNYERYRLRQGAGRQRVVLATPAEQGVFQYNVAGQVRQVNLFQLAAANGQTVSADPVVGRLLQDIRDATQSEGGVQASTDPNLLNYTFTSRGDNFRWMPAGRVDVNLTQKHRLGFSFNSQHFRSDPGLNAEYQFPGFTNRGTQDTHRYVWTSTARSTLSPRMVNEAVVGRSDFPSTFNKFVTSGNFDGDEGPGSTQGGFNLGISAAGVTNATRTAAINGGNSPILQASDTLNWINGSHSLAFGGSFSEVKISTWSQTLAPTIAFGVDSRDPALAMFTTANFPGASTANLSAAQNLYAVLTGRVTGITGNAVLDQATNQYAYLGRLEQGGRMREMGMFAQDSWRFRPNLTFTYGLRWDVQFPFSAANSVYSTGSVADVWGVSGVGHLFQPGVLSGQRPQFVRYEEGVKAFNTDLNNFAPSAGFAWRPGGSSRLGRIAFGADGATVIRAGYGLAYTRRGMSDFTAVFAGNPGATVTANRNASVGNLGTLPLLLRDTGNLGPGAFASTPNYPLTGAVTAGIRIFDPNLQTPYAQSWSVGLQRALGKATAIEARYVGTRHLQGWSDFNLNEVNVVENNFLSEFKAAQANLRSNIAAGRGSSFAYFGPGTGTAPLPTYLAYLTGSSQAGDAARYAAAQFTNSTFVNRLALFNPNVTAAAGDLNGDAARRANALAAGLPSNFFVVNPDLLGGATITGNGGYTRYNSLQLELRRRLTAGFLVQGSYVYAKSVQSSRVSFRTPLTETAGENAIRHAMKVNWVYELPFGRGRRFEPKAGSLLNTLVGGWELNGAGQILSGDILDFGNVQLVGMSDAELQKTFKLRFDDANSRVYMLPQDIIDNTIKAFNTSATSTTGYGALGAPSGRYFAPPGGPDCVQVVAGDCAPQHHFVTGPRFVRFDISLVKRIPLGSRMNLELRGEALNAFNNINFTPVAGVPSNVQNLGLVTAAYRDTGNTQDFGGRMVQIVSRISW
jgi:hypothetical protein